VDSQAERAGRGAEAASARRRSVGVGLESVAMEEGVQACELCAPVADGAFG
jgi:hypothetical protein